MAVLMRVYGAYSIALRVANLCLAVLHRNEQRIGALRKRETCRHRATTNALERRLRVARIPHLERAVVTAAKDEPPIVRKHGVCS